MTHRITALRTSLAAAALTAAALVPASASAHGSVFFVTPQVSTGTPPVLSAGPVQYVVAQHG
ncbi:MAG: hypothetical protein JHD16_09475, partial [Solirubrobacteraceae bacterium]|nr:hypothetical protein [Solirubrobacteraceae bacterium]